MDIDFILDEYNLKGLHKYVPNLNLVISIIVDFEKNIGEVDMNDNKNELNNQAILIYGLIHARYLRTTKGLQLIVLLFNYYNK